MWEEREREKEWVNLRHSLAVTSEFAIISGYVTATLTTLPIFHISPWKNKTKPKYYLDSAKQE